MLNGRSRVVAREFLARYETLNYASLVEEQSFRLKNLLSSVHNDPFDVFFGPSGTDLAYLPTLFQRLLQPDKPIIQLMSCPEELGSGSMDVAAARLFGRQNQFGRPLDLFHAHGQRTIDLRSSRCRRALRPETNVPVRTETDPRHVDHRAVSEPHARPR